jgi:hypothetical protein
LLSGVIAKHIRMLNMQPKRLCQRAPIAPPVRTVYLARSCVERSFERPCGRNRLKRSRNPADEDGGTKPYGTGSNNVHHCDHEFARARWLRWFRKGQYERSSPGNL